MGRVSPLARVDLDRCAAHGMLAETNAPPLWLRRSAFGGNSADCSAQLRQLRASEQTVPAPPHARPTGSALAGQHSRGHGGSIDAQRSVRRRCQHKLMQRAHGQGIASTVTIHHRQVQHGRWYCDRVHEIPRRIPPCNQRSSRTQARHHRPRSAVQKIPSALCRASNVCSRKEHHVGTIDEVPSIRIIHVVEILHIHGYHTARLPRRC